MIWHRVFSMLLQLPSIIYHNAKKFPFHFSYHHLSLVSSSYFSVRFYSAILLPQHWTWKEKKSLRYFLWFHICSVFFFYISIIDNRLSTNIGKITHDDFVLWIIFVTCFSFRVFHFFLLCFSCLIFFMLYFFFFTIIKSRFSSCNLILWGFACIYIPFNDS